LDVESWYFKLQVPTSPNLFGAAVLHPGTKTYQVES
jgi:hypothetical protein